MGWDGPLPASQGEDPRVCEANDPSHGANHDQDDYVFASLVLPG